MKRIRKLLFPHKIEELRRELMPTLWRRSSLATSVNQNEEKPLAVDGPTAGMVPSVEKRGEGKGESNRW
jgi:hypothetical protein